MLADLGNGTASVGTVLAPGAMGLLHVRLAGSVPEPGTVSKLEILAVTDTTALDPIGLEGAVAVGPLYH